MALDFGTLLTPESRDTIKANLLSIADTLGLRTTNWFAGAPTRTVIAATAWILEAYQNVVVSLTRSHFLDYATGVGLTRLAYYVYGVERIEATYATGSVTLTNSGGGVYSWDAGDLVLKNTATGVTYVNDEAISLGASSSVTAVFLAQEIGSDGSASVGQIDALVTTALGVTCSNPGALSGIDAEEDSTLRVRCRASLGPLSPNGPRRAIEYVCTTPELVSGVAVNRVKVSQPNGDGIVYVYIAAPDGALSGPDVALVQAGVDVYATAEVQTNIVASATDLSVDVGPTVYVTSGVLSDSEWQDEVTDALDAYIAGLPIGGVTAGAANIIPWRALVGVIKQIQIGDSATFEVISCNLASEADVSLLETEVAIPGTYTITIVQVT